MRYYQQISSAYFGVPTYESVPESPGIPMFQLKDQYIGNNKEMQRLISERERVGCMSFPEWTWVPEGETRNPGVYFIEMLERKKNTLATEWYAAKVECEDPHIGFAPFRGVIATWDINKTEEFLRELFIAEKIIKLCIEAKQRQERFEKDNHFVNAKGETAAFMRIISVKPGESTTSGPSALIPNPKYNPEEKNPGSERFRKYNVKFWKPFIQEYPVEILLQCDVNTYMRFLHSVRSQGQFLVIRTLQIISPFMEDSLEDKSELEAVVPKNDETDPNKKAKLKDEHILVRMSAAGMAFFDPEKYKRGLYESGKKEVRPVNTGRRLRSIPQGN